MADTIENFVRAGSFRDSWRDRFQNKWPAMTTMLMRSESEIDYPNITPCPDFGIKNPSIRSWGSNPDTWTADSRGGEITDEESSSRVAKGDKRCEKLCRGVLCVFLILSVLAAAFAGIGLAILLTQPEFGLTEKSEKIKDSFLDAGLEEPEMNALTDTFCGLVIKMLNESNFPTDRGISSCEAVLKYTKGLEGLHIEIDVKPTEGYTLKEKFLRSLKKIVAKRKEEERAEANTKEDNQRNIFKNTGLIFPKTGGFIEFLPEIWKSSSSNKSGDNTTDNKTVSNQPNTTNVTVNTASHQVKKKVHTTSEGMIENGEKEQGVTMTQNGTTDTIEANYEHETESMKNVFVDMDKTGIKSGKEQVKATNESTSNDTNYTQEIIHDLTDMLSPSKNIIEENSGLMSSSISTPTTRSSNFTISFLNKSTPLVTENELDNPSTTSMSGLLSYNKEGVTSPLNNYTEPFETTLTKDTTSSTNISQNETTADFEKESTVNTLDEISTLPSSTSTVNESTITTSTLKPILAEIFGRTEPTFNTKEAKKTSAIQSVKLFEVNNMGNNSGVVLNKNKPITKGQRDIVAESLMSGGFMRLPMKTTSNFKFLFSSGSRKNKSPGNDDVGATSTVVVKERTDVERTKI